MIGLSFGNIRVEGIFFEVLVFSDPEGGFVDRIIGSNGKTDRHGLGQAGLRIEEEGGRIANGIA